MNITESKAANALGGKTARACDSCLIKRARWFCTADDAFLCQACDASVHSANQLASRHERVRLETSSFKGHDVINNSSSTPAWHQGFTRKARTPRHAKSARLQPPKDHHQPLALVPEINSEEPFGEEINEEEQRLYRVPVFDPFGDEFCITHEMVKGEEKEEADDDDVDLNLEELLLSTCDVESLLGNGDGEGSSACGIDDIDLGLVERVDCGDEGQNMNDHEVSLGGKRVKVEEEDDDDDEVQAVIACHFDPALDMELNWDFDYASSMSNGETDEMKTEDVGVELGTINNVDVTIMSRSGEESQVDITNNKKNRMLQLRLNYEAVIAAWETQGSPWTNGIRPHEFNFDEFMDACSGGNSHTYGGFGGRLGVNDAGREARVWRYREKRRTRLFSKKIRYQVRKLNAEKRPRMKGRFVKRTNFSGPYLPYMMNK